MSLSAISDRFRLHAGAALFALGLWASAASCARAQSASSPTTASEDTLALLAPVPLSTKNPLLRPRRDYQGMPVSGWLLFPALTLGGIYDDNVSWSAHRPTRAAGFRIAPTLAAEREVDGHRLALAAGADAKFYPSVSHIRSLDAAVGGDYRWSATPDLTFKASAKYSRASSPIGSDVVLSSGRLTTLISPLLSDKIEGSLAVQKNFGRAFAGLSLDTAKVTYAPLDTATGRVSQHYRDSWVNTLTARGGAFISPVVYAFTEASGNMRDYSGPLYASKGYRMIAGLGSDRISLFRGELFAGVQQQFYSGATHWSARSPVFGGKIFWYPLRDLTVRATVDQTISDSSLSTPGNPLGYPARATKAELSVQHALTRDLLISWRLGYEADRYMRSARADDIWKAGVGVTYSPRRNIDILLDYEFSRATSNDASARYRRNVANAAVKYRF